MKMSKVLTFILLVAIALPAAAAEKKPRELGVAPPTRVPNAEVITPLPAGEPVALTAVPRAVRRAVVADAAKRFNVAESAVVLTRAEQVNWSDGSLGCAAPGGMYTQNLVPGFRIVATTGAGELTYHTDARAYVVNCRAWRLMPANKLSEKTPVRGAAPSTQPPPAPER